VQSSHWDSLQTIIERGCYLLSRQTLTVHARESVHRPRSLLAAAVDGIALDVFVLTLTPGFDVGLDVCLESLDVVLELAG